MVNSKRVHLTRHRRTHWSLATDFIPSSRCGTTISFRYTRAGAPPGRICAAETFERSGIGVLDPAPLVSAIAAGGGLGGGRGAVSVDGAVAAGPVVGVASG